MEQWQIKYINYNLVRLTELTKPSTTLKNILRQNALITDEDYDRLSNIGKHSCHEEEATELYAILKRKSNGYSGLMDALKEDRQSGAWNVLLAGLHAEKLSYNKIHLAQFLELTVTVRKGRYLLRELLPGFRSVDMEDVLQSPLMYFELQNLLAQEHPLIKLDFELPSENPIYIQRSISNRLVLDPKIFLLDCKDVFVFKGLPKRELAKLVMPNVMRSSTDQRTIITCRHIYLDDDEDWDDMALVCEGPLHLTRKEGDNFILVRSTQVTDNVISYSSKQDKYDDAYISEDSLVKQLLNGTKGALICDVPGMGKTWLMESIARKLPQSNPDTLVFFNLLSFVAEYAKELEKPLTPEEALQYAIQLATGSKLMAYILTHSKNIFPLKAVFILDGYDEVSAVSTMTTFLQLVDKNDSVRLIISSRPHLRKRLETSFNVLSRDILPFTEENQVSAIVGHWLGKFPDASLKSLEDFAKQCVKSTKTIFKQDAPKILGVPLLCKILATVSEKHAKQLLNKRRLKSLEVAEMATAKSIFWLYKSFVDDAIQKVAPDEPPNNDKVKRAINFHIFKSLELIFPENYNIATSFAEHQRLNDALTHNEDINKIGLLTQTQKSDFEFIHRSFAEYFVGHFFAEFWSNVSDYKHNFVEIVVPFFIQQVLATSAEGVYETFGCVTSDGGYFPIDKTNFSYAAVLWFMNSFALTGKMQWLTSSNSKKALQDVPSQRSHLRENVFGALLACIDSRLTCAMALIVDIVKVIFEKHAIGNLLHVTPDYYKTNYWGIRSSYEDVHQVCLPLILTHVAASGSPETACELFNLFSSISTNYLPDFCANFPLEYWSPLEAAIDRNDLDMFIYFMNKMTLPWERTVLRCLELTTMPGASQDEVNKRVAIFEELHIPADMAPNVLLDDFKKYLAKNNAGVDNDDCWIWAKFAFRNKILIDTLPQHVQIKYLEEVLLMRDDEHLIMILLLAFGKAALTATINADGSILAKKYANYSSELLAGVEDVRTDEVLRCLDLSEAKRVFANIWIERHGINGRSNELFSRIHKLRSLQLLIGILPNFKERNVRKRNYIHFAVSAGNVKWIKYLIEHGYDVNEIDRDGCTPLHLISMRQPVEVTSVLYENGADMGAVNKRNENLAHTFLRNELDEDVVCQWVNYMLMHGSNEIWLKHDTSYYETPLMILSKKYQSAKRLVDLALGLFD